MKMLSSYFRHLAYRQIISLCFLLLAPGLTLAAGWQTSTVESAGIVGEYSSIAVDAAGTPHVAYRDYTNGTVKYAKWNGSAWATTVIGSFVAPNGYYLSGGRNGIALDGNGYPHIVYYRTNVGYYYTHWTGSAWTAPSLIPAPPPTTPYPCIPIFGDVSIAVDKTTGVAHVTMLYIDYGYSLVYWNSSLPGSQIIDEDIASSTWRTGFRNAIAVDSTGKPHITYEMDDDASGIMYIKYATWTGSSWSFSIVGQTGAYPDMGSGGRPLTSIAIDSSNRPHVAFYGANSKYVYARWTGSSWNTSFPSPSYAPVDAEFVSLALDASDTPHIAMQVLSYDLVYATVKSGVWTQTTLDSSSGEYCSIAVDGGKNVHISYYDDWDNDLKYASNSRTTLMAPNGGETIAAGSDKQIAWTAPHNAVKYKLFYSIDNGVTWYPITTNFVTGSSYLWSVPGMKKTKTTCRVKVTGYTSAGVSVGSDASNAPFTIENVTFSSPTLNQTVTAGGQLTAAWTTHKLTGTPVTIAVSYTLDGGMTWKSLGTVAGDAAQYVWDPVALVTKPKTKSRIKLVFKDGAGKTVGNAVTPYFTVTP